MLGAGYLSWMRSDLTGRRFWLPLVGGLVLSVGWGYYLLSNIIAAAW